MNSGAASNIPAGIKVSAQATLAARSGIADGGRRVSP